MRPERSILLIEDDDIDILTIKRAFRELEVKNSIEYAKNGEEALRLLRGERKSLPSLILLDINMPIMNGAELLKEIKQDPVLKTIPVVVLTTSNADTDKLQSFRNGAAGYMVKPVDYKNFLELIDLVISYWSASELPPGLAA